MSGTLSTLSFRPARISDVEEVVALVQAAYRGETSRKGWTHEADLLDGQRTDPGMVQRIIDSPEAMVLLAHSPAGELVGCCELALHPGEDGEERVVYFGMFAVWPDLQGKGIGDLLLTEAEQVARRRWGADRMRMTVISRREPLIAYYRRRRYVPNGRREPFPYGDERYGRPLTDDLEFVVLEKTLG